MKDETRLLAVYRARQGWLRDALLAAGYKPTWQEGDYQPVDYWVISDNLKVQCLSYSGGTPGWVVQQIDGASFTFSPLYRTPEEVVAKLKKITA